MFDCNDIKSRQTYVGLCSKGKMTIIERCWEGGRINVENMVCDARNLFLSYSLDFKIEWIFPKGNVKWAANERIKNRLFH